MRVAIVGSRDYKNLAAVREYVANISRDDVVVSGGARGVDRTAVDTAEEFDLRWAEYPADWAKHGRKAGIVRNRELVAAVDRLVAFWDGTSRGTAHAVDEARRIGIPVIVFGPDGREIA